MPTYSTVVYTSSASNALIDNYSSRKRLGRPLAITNQKKMRIKDSITDVVRSETPQLLAHKPEFISTCRRCVYYNTKAGEKKEQM